MDCAGLQGDIEEKRKERAAGPSPRMLVKRKGMCDAEKLTAEAAKAVLEEKKKKKKGGSFFQKKGKEAQRLPQTRKKEEIRLAGRRCSAQDLSNFRGGKTGTATMKRNDFSNRGGNSLIGRTLL